tara:strand:+ start:3909 stop:4139 length:231 start_codon:yes stop_codon:yes gene_type:complete
MKSYISAEYYKKSIEDDCIKIPKKYKYNTKDKSHPQNQRYLYLRNKDSIHSHKNMRKQSKDYKDFVQNLLDYQDRF